VNYQEFTSYIEYAPIKRASAFVEVPIRSIQPDPLASATGLGDIRMGAKGALIYCEDTVLTAQLRTYFPSGEPTKGLGTDHYTLEPALLLYYRLGDRLFYEGEFRDWIPIGGSDFAGNVIRGGSGLSYLLVNAPRWQLAPVVELVGWTVLSGKEFAATGPLGAFGAVQNASGDTIINAKFGTRIGFGEVSQPGNIRRSDLYVGYGRALTGDVWYKDILRVEYRLKF
jgi:hypothetical protein